MKLGKFIKGLSLLCAGMLIVMCMGACDGSRKVKELRSRGMYSENEIVFPIKSNNALLGQNLFGVTSFNSKQNLKELLQIILESKTVSSHKSYPENLETSGAGDSLFLMRDNGDGTKDCFSVIVTSKDSNKKFQYQLNSLRMQIFYESESGERQTFWALFPFHLVPGLHDSASAYMSVEYTTKATLKDFYDFYSDCGWFDVEQQESAILIKGFKPNVKIATENTTPAFAYRIIFRNYLDLTLIKIEKA